MSELYFFFKNDAEHQTERLVADLFLIFKETLYEIQVITAWKVPKYGVFLVLIFPNLDWIRENKDQKKIRIWTLFTQWIGQHLVFDLYFLH